MLDIEAIEQEAQEELQENTAKEAKAKIKAHLKRISDAKKIVANLEAEYKVLLKDIAS